MKIEHLTGKKAKELLKRRAANERSLPFKGVRPVHLSERTGDDWPFLLHSGRHVFCLPGAGGRRPGRLEPGHPHLQLYQRQRPDDRHGRRHPVLHFAKPGQPPGGQPDVFTHVLYLAGVLACLFVAAGLLFAGDIVRLFGGTGNVFTMSRTYLRVILLFSPAFLMNNVLLCFVRNDGAPQLSMAAMIGGSLSNVVLDWVFIFPCGMGIFGAVFATGLAPIISMAILSPHFFRRKNNSSIPWPADPRARTLGRILSSGAPSLVTEVSSGIVIIVFNTLILGLEGNIGVAAYGVIANLSLVVIAIYTGIAQGIQPILSRSYGGGDRDRLSAILRYAVITMLGVSVVIYGAVLTFAPQIAAVFNSEGSPTLQAIAVQGLRLYFIACPFAGCNVVLSMYFTSTDRPLPAHAISLLRGFFLIIPVALLLAAVGQMVGIWLAFPVTECLVALLAVGLFLRSRRKPAHA